MTLDYMTADAAAGGHSAMTVAASIHEQNRGSQRLFEAQGFRPTAAQAERYQLWAAEIVVGGAKETGTTPSDIRAGRGVVPVQTPSVEHVFYSGSMPRVPPFHVWVDLTGKWAGPAPGVLLAWRHTERRGWEAWVVRAESYSTGVGVEVLLTQAWVSAALVRPAKD